LADNAGYFEEVLERVMEIPGAPSTSSSFLDSLVRMALNAHPNVEMWEDKYIDALAYYVMHNYTKISAATESPMNAVAKGTLQSIRTGNLSESYYPNTSYKDDGWVLSMKSTTYGEMYYDLFLRVGDTAPEAYGPYIEGE